MPNDITLTSQFRSNQILHIENELCFKDSAYRNFSDDQCIKDALGCSTGQRIIQVKSDILHIRGDIGSTVDDEVSRVISEAGDNPCIIGISNAAIARGYLEKHLPAVIISDTAFPLNGQKIIEWLLSHGLSDYAVIGLSGTDPRSLNDVVRTYFMTSNARYFLKDKVKPRELRAQIALNIQYNCRTFGGT